MRDNPKNAPQTAYDIIGDVHGEFDQLVALLVRLGYRELGGAWRHPEGIKAIFVGDLVDRGPKVAEVVALAKAMVEAGEAQAILGNHEHNLICYLTPDGKGGYLRPHTDQNLELCHKTLEAYRGRETELSNALNWFRSLPFALDLPGFRVVHAQWDETLVSLTENRNLLDDAFLRLSATKGTAEYRAVGTLLKGNELALPEGVFIVDGHGIRRDKFRLRWPNLKAGISYQEASFPPRPDLPDTLVPEAALLANPGYPADEKPVFFGHYAIEAWPLAPLTPNAACLDFGCAKGGRLTAYRWRGERVLSADHFVTS